MNESLDYVTALLPGLDIVGAQRLSSGDRSIVDRITVRGHDFPTLIAKRYLKPDTRWIREKAALSIVGDDITAPRLIAAGNQSVLMADLGTGRSLADSLRGPDADAAAADLMRWVGAVATLHLNTAGRRAEFAEAMTGDEAVAVAPHAETARNDLVELQSLAATLGVTDVEGGLVEAAAAIDHLEADSPDTHALTPADACPDNNIAVGDRLALVDFEGAQWRHVAWDVAYLRVPWPTCWCSWRMPDSLAAAALDHYRALAGPMRPYVRTPDFAHDLEIAATLWSITSISWFLTSALEGDTRLGPGPQRRGIIQHRLRHCAAQTHLTRLAAFAEALHSATVDAWGQYMPLLAPAFRD